MGEIKDYLNTNLYEILNISTNATDVEIKAAFRLLVRQYHPDVNPNYEEKFKEIKNAYDILSDSQKKYKYDKLNGYNEINQKSTTTSSINNEDVKIKAQAKKAYSENENKHKTFDSLFKDILNNLKPNNKVNGTDIELNVKISYQEAIIGTSRIVNVLHTNICPKCNGKKFVNEAKCSYCNGLGEIKKHKKINIKIPPNVKTGSKIRIVNEGNQGLNGGQNGDLYLNIEVNENDINNFKVIDNDVYTKAIIEPYQAVLGDIVCVENFKGEKIKLKIPKKTKSEQKFKIASEGLIPQKNQNSGDLIVEIIIDIKSQVSSEEIELYKKIKELKSKD